MLSFIGMFREGLWPGGELKLPDSPRTTEEKQRTRDEANRKLSSLIPGLFFASPENPMKLGSLIPRFGRQCNRTIKCTTWGKKNFCRFTESTSQPAYCLHNY
jgi:Sorting nexin C terminal